MKVGDTLSSSTVTYRVHNTLSRINDLPEKDDLRKWPPNARRSLRLAGDVSLVAVPRHPVPSEETFTVPKLALMVASPTLREFIIKEPEVTEIELVEGSFQSGAVGLLCYWLTSICDWNAQAVPYLPCPGNLLQALELRHAAQLLSMDKYVRSFEIKYILDVQNRVPCLSEAVAVSMYTFSDDDPVLNAWASRVRYLQRSSSLSLEYFQGLVEILGTEDHHKLHKALEGVKDILYEEEMEALEIHSSEDWPLIQNCELPSEDLYT